jgi:hypothetical protein
MIDVTHADTDDLSDLATQLKEQAERLASAAHEAEDEVKVLEAESMPEPLDPDFADNLEKSLAEPRKRLRSIAKSAR